MSIAYAANIGRCTAFCNYCLLHCLLYFLLHCLCCKYRYVKYSWYIISLTHWQDKKDVCHNRSSEDGATLKAAFPRRHWCCHWIPPKPGCTWNPQQGALPPSNLSPMIKTHFSSFFRTLVPSRDWRSPPGWPLRSLSCFLTSSLHGSGFKSFRFFSFLMALVQILNSFQIIWEKGYSNRATTLLKITLSVGINIQYFGQKCKTYNINDFDP